MADQNFNSPMTLKLRTAVELINAQTTTVMFHHLLSNVLINADYIRYILINPCKSDIKTKS